MKKALVALGLLLGGVTNASGRGFGGGRVTQIIIQQYGSAGVLIFRVEGRGGAPACATTGRFAVPLSGASGRAMYATLQTQFARGDTVGVDGLGTCNTWPDSEDVNYLWIGPGS